MHETVSLGGDVGGHHVAASERCSIRWSKTVTSFMHLTVEGSTVAIVDSAVQVSWSPRRSGSWVVVQRLDEPVLHLVMHRLHFVVSEPSLLLVKVFSVHPKQIIDYCVDLNLILNKNLQIIQEFEYLRGDN